MTAVFLDLDGTLMDSRPGILASVIAALGDVGRPDLAEGDLTWMIGPPLIESFPKLGLADPTAALEAYREHYEGGGLFDAKVYDGIPAMLSAAKEAGHRLYLATAKPHVAAKRVTRHFGLSDSMLAEFGPELDGTRNWKGDLLAHALEVTGESASDSVMVGDRHHDVSAAKSVGMPSIAVRWGYGEEVEWDGAAFIIAHPSELHDAVARL